MEDVLLPVCLVRDSREVAEATPDLHLIRFEARLHPEGTSGPALAGKAVTDGDGKRIARDLQAKLPAVTDGLSSSHGQERYVTAGLASSPSPAALSRTPRAATTPVAAATSDTSAKNAHIVPSP